MLIDEEEYLEHYGTPRRSGRYPWGSGDDDTPQRSRTWHDEVKQLEKDGLSQAEIARGYEITVNDLRASVSIASNRTRAANIAFAQGLKDKGTSATEIGRRMGVAESTVRSWLAPGAKDKADAITNTANMLRKEMETKEILEVGKGTENYIGVSKTRLDTAIAVLRQEGYELYQIKDPQLTTGHDTNVRVLARPGTTWKEVVQNKDKIELITNTSENNGESFQGLMAPLPISSNRVAVVHKEQGGDKADGVMYVRPGIADVSLGGKDYAQVRVAVGNDHYLKGMAIYKEDLPKGVDIEFHTSKSNTGNKLDAMKKNSDEKGFTAEQPHPLLKSIRKQIIENPGTPDAKVTSVMNIVNEEGSWSTWANTLSSQMLSKQKPILAKTQLEMTQERRQNEFDQIMKLTNPVVRKKLLMDFADGADSAAVHHKAAALPRTGPHVILPLSKIKPTEIYAPGFDNGEKVVLIRHPHGGTFEIPELTVNNRNPEGRKLLGTNTRDAVGIHHETAARLSGADFDGDTVLVIPNNKGRVQHTKALEELKDFDPRSAYPAYEGMKRMRNTQAQMGEISNLITDMSIQGAPHSEIARAVKHSMVVIDAEKHNLDHKLSYSRNGIKSLKDKYQVGGASTIISRARAEERGVPKTKPRPAALGGPINKQTGALEFVPTGDGKTMRVKKIANTHDARTLMSSPIGTPMERLYANHSNELKKMANRSRLAAINTPTTKQSPSARKVYKTEVDRLNAALETARRNLPLERQAQRFAAANVRARQQDNPDMDPETLKKIKTQALNEARIRTGAQKKRIVISDAEWNAIQANAISPSKLGEILNNADMEVVRQHATPKDKKLLTPVKTARAKQMLASGFTRAEVAEHLGVSLSTLDDATQS